MLALFLVAAATCRPCHQKIVDSYAETGMGRSFAKATQVPPLDNFTHAKSQRSYSVVQRDGRYHLRRALPEMERSIDYVIGSGNHSKTFLHLNTAGKLIELPLSLYGDKWAMSPGYDRPDHSDMRREVTDSCLFCHTSYPPAGPIDCERCHSSGGGHFVNPAKLAPARQLEVCLQCHLESASRTLPEAIRQPGRSVFSYRPGEPLSDYKVYFEYANPPKDDRITVNGAGYGLLKSQCFIRSQGRLQCTTCHDPHGQTKTNVCASCHRETHGQDCIGCHMPKRRTEDAVHVVMTDHLIRKRPPPGDLLAAIEERHDKITGPVKLLYPSTLANPPQRISEPTELSRLNATAIAYVGQSRFDEALALMQRAVRLAPEDPVSWLNLGVCLEAKGNMDGAAAAYSQAAVLQPEFARAKTYLMRLKKEKQK